MPDRIRALLDVYDRSSTECDGMTRVCHTVLLRENIPHICMVGVILYGSKRLPIHLWIDLLDEWKGCRVDYRARPWLGDFPDVPHGVFRPEEFPKVSYQEASPRNLPPLPDELFKVLTTPLHQMKP
jgi:hypothetical protein